MKITFEFSGNFEDDGQNSEDMVKAKRMMHADDAFSLLLDITQAIARHQDKKDDNDVADHAIKSDEQLLDDIVDDINKSNLLDLWL